jgi:uncharacterized protein YyaL (SSP411 family)
MQDGKNYLGAEQSPYLLEHRDNPVWWHPWGRAAFERARLEDKPVFLSIGYSTGYPNNGSCGSENGVCVQNHLGF